MVQFDGLDIEVTRGDTFQFKITFSGRTLTNATALVTVKKSPRDEEPVIEKRISIENNEVYVGFSHEDTDLPPRTYFWDTRVLIPYGDGANEVKTPMQYAAFMVTEVIGNA